MLSLLFASFVWRSAAHDFFDIDDVDDQLNLLQVKAHRHNRTDDHTGRNPPRCNGFGNDFFDARRGIKADYQPDLLNNRFTAPSELEYCRCYGDTHCTAVPFDLERPSGVEGLTTAAHYSYDGLGVSRYAKAADGSWEVQIFQCGMGGGGPAGGHVGDDGSKPTGEVGVAIKVDGIVVEAGIVWSPPVGNIAQVAVKCLVNGESKPDGYELHLPTGFHFQCPVATTAPGFGRTRHAFLGTFCASKEGQFVSELTHLEWGYQTVHNLYVKKGVETQKENTVCYDPVSKDWGTRKGLAWNGRGEIATTAIVAAEDVIFSQTMLDHMKSGSCFLQDPPQSAVPAGEPADPKTVCDQRDPGAWEHAQEVCSPLQDSHPLFYSDCLLDDCASGNDSEEEEIEEIAEGDEAIEEEIDNQADGAAAVGDPHITSPRVKYDLDPSMLKHHHQ